MVHGKKPRLLWKNKQTNARQYSGIIDNLTTVRTEKLV